MQMATFFNAFHKALTASILRSFFLRLFCRDTKLFSKSADLRLLSLISLWSNESNKCRLELIGFRTEIAMFPECFLVIFVQSLQVE